jgi:hypothetical protein
MDKKLLQLLDGAKDKYLHTLEQQFTHVAPSIVDAMRIADN